MVAYGESGALNGASGIGNNANCWQFAKGNEK
jgi:hypothetical protein